LPKSESIQGWKGQKGPHRVLQQLIAPVLKREKGGFTSARVGKRKGKTLRWIGKSGGRRGRKEQRRYIKIQNFQAGREWGGGSTERGGRQACGRREHKEKSAHTNLDEEIQYEREGGQCYRRRTGTSEVFKKKKKDELDNGQREGES